MHQTAPWPYEELDVAALAHRGWRSTPLREFVLKLHQRCNLACDYCYVYTLADQSWRQRPKVMPPRVYEAAANRISEHVRRHDLTEIAVILHGGEPLLVGVDRIVAIVDCVSSAIPSSVEVRFHLQTNGVLLDSAMLDMLKSRNVRIGVSVDGAEADHDRHRFGVNGAGSFADVRCALALLSSRNYRELYSGLLATIDPETDPVACYEALLEFCPPSVDLLLPHANWSTPHPAACLGRHPFGTWLVAVFDRWYDAPVQETRIRLFEGIVDAALGGHSRSESVGLSPVALAVIESDGMIEQVDSLKSAYHGAASTGLSVFDHSFDQALEHPGFVARQVGIEALSDSCRTCELHQTCGGGLYPHRYKAGVGFRNPSVYCADLGHLVTHVQSRVYQDLALPSG